MTNDQEIIVRLFLCLNEDEFKYLLKLYHERNYEEFYVAAHVYLLKYYKKIRNLQLTEEMIKETWEKIEANPESKPVLKYEMYRN